MFNVYKQQFILNVGTRFYGRIFFHLEILRMTYCNNFLPVILHDLLTLSTASQVVFTFTFGLFLKNIWKNIRE